jgi:2-polyprenyl-3-methyl-5-hydroxy-6-metoxy-1,4-benzoquinol methylase
MGCDMSGSEAVGGDQAASRRVLVFTATYCEAGNVELLCGDILALPCQADVLVVDDNSPDGTGDILDRMAEAESRLAVVHRPRKLGLGSAHKLAMAYAVRHRYDVLITMDADLSHAPNEIPRLLEGIERADFVIGSRYMPGGQCEYTGYRRNVSMLANIFARHLLGIALHEFTTSFRAFSVPMLAEVQFSRIRSQGYSFFMEAVWHIHRAGRICCEVPITFSDRLHGESKIPKNEIFNGMRKLAELCLLRLIRWRRPRLPNAEVNAPCYLCGSDMVVELYPKLDGADVGAEAYRCTSMTHQKKPQVVQCLTCGLAAAGEMPTADELDQLYLDVVDQTYLKNKTARAKTFAHAMATISPFLPAKGRMLEVGAYCGLFMQVAKKHGWQVEGVEPSRWASEQAKAAGLTVHKGTLEASMGVIEGDRDAIVMWDVLEHLADPMAELKRLRDLLDDDGVMCLSTLDMDTWFPRLLGHRWPWIMDMHLYYFGHDVLEDMLQRAGFELVADMPYRHYASLDYFFEKVAAMLPSPLSHVVGFCKALAPKWIFVPFHFGDVRLFVCRKAKRDEERDNDEFAATSAAAGGA